MAGFLFQELRQAYSGHADDDFKAMVLMALNNSVELTADFPETGIDVEKQWWWLSNVCSPRWVP